MLNVHRNHKAYYGRGKADRKNSLMNTLADRERSPGVENVPVSRLAEFRLHRACLNKCVAFSNRGQNQMTAGVNSKR